HFESLSVLYVLPYSAPSPTATYTLSLHDALPIFREIDRRALAIRLRVVLRRVEDVRRVPMVVVRPVGHRPQRRAGGERVRCGEQDRKSTRLNSSHDQISYAVFCLKKKN